MKLFYLFLITITISLSLSKSSLDDYSIDEFIAYLKKLKIFDSIVMTKAFFGADVAINFCECLTGTQKGNCAKVVRDYIENIPFNPFNPNYTPNPGKEISKFIEKNMVKGYSSTPEENIIIVNCQKCLDKFKEVFSKYNI